MPQERHAQLSQLVDRSLRTSTALIVLLALAGLGTAAGLWVAQNQSVSGQALPLSSAHHQENVVLAVAALALMALIAWAVLSLRRARRTARHLLGNLRDAIGAIERGRAELQAFTDAAPLAVFHVDTTGTPKWVNAQATLWSGSVLDEGLAAVMKGGIHADDKSRVLTAWERLVNNGDRFEEVFRFETPDDLSIWAHAHASAVLVDGVTTGFVAVMQDVTEARVLQDEVVRSRRRMRRLTDAVPALLARLDDKETYRFVNATYKAWFGEDAPVIGVTLREFLGDSAYARLKPSFDRVRAGQAVRFEMCHENLHGRSFVGDITYTPDFDDEGRYCGFYIMVTDISERKRLEENLFAAKELAQVTLESIGHAVITTDNAGIVTSLNQRAEALLQRPAGRARGLPIDALVHLTDAHGAPVETSLLPAIEGQRLVDQTEPKRLAHCDGSFAAIEDVAAPIRNRAGLVVGGVLVLRDVSETQALVDRMRRLAELDALTGLPNRLVFDERLRAALSRLQPAERCAVLYMDLDGFKAINDTFGHNAGDALLCAVARRFAEAAGTSDTVCRLGGDEFVVLLPAPVSLREAMALATRFVDSARLPVPWQGHRLSVTLSVGVAIAPDDGTDALALMRQADAALYMAKASGKNQVCPSTKPRSCAHSGT
jgi:diguanylate cyclase (GGDEF)-like protein/PAS domain S-box-containing protein